MIFFSIFGESKFSFTRSSRSETVCPDVDRNFSNSEGFGNSWDLILANSFLTSASLNLMPREEASPSTHCEEMRKPRTSLCSDLYSVAHWLLSSAVVGAFWPLAGLAVVAARWAMHAV